MTTAQLPQPMKALERANFLRLEGASIRAQMAQLPGKASRRRAAELLLDPPEAIAHMRLGHFLRGIRSVGNDKAVDLVKEARLDFGVLQRRVGPIQPTNRHPQRRILTGRQRAELAHVLASV